MGKLVRGRLIVCFKSTVEESIWGMSFNYIGPATARFDPLTYFSAQLPVEELARVCPKRALRRA